jgi:hypothetical protein
LVRLRLLQGRRLLLNAPRFGGRAESRPPNCALRPPEEDRDQDRLGADRQADVLRQVFCTGLPQLWQSRRRALLRVAESLEVPGTGENLEGRLGCETGQRLRTQHLIHSSDLPHRCERPSSDLRRGFARVRSGVQADAYDLRLGPPEPLRPLRSRGLVAHLPPSFPGRQRYADVRRSTSTSTKGTSHMARREGTPLELERNTG